MSTSTNYFDIPTPQIYRCNVFRYHSGLSRMYVRVFKGMSEAPSFYLLFPDVGYFEGPMNWKGVEFQQQDDDACLALMRSTGMVEDFLLEDAETRQALAEAAKLYVLQTPLTTVRIIAGDAIKLTEIPPEIAQIP